MTDIEHAPQSDTDTEARLQLRALSTTRQWQIVGGVAVTLISLVALGWLGDDVAANTAPQTAAPDDTTFAINDAQLAGLTLETVGTHPFHSSAITDGRIALNGDATTPVFSPYSGRVTKLLANVGDTVKAGQPLFVIETVEYAQACSDLLNAAAQLQLAQQMEQRKHAAFDAQGGSQQDWQQAQADLVVAQSALATARNHLRVFAKSEADITAILDKKTYSGTTEVTAPIGGVITDRQIGPGQLLQSGASTPAFTIGDLSKVWLVANVREVDAPQLKVGQSIVVNVLALPGKTFNTKLVSVGAVVDPVTRRVPVRAVLDNANGQLKPEMFASFHIATSDDSNGVAVPATAVVREGDNAHVWVLNDKKRMELRNIHLGREADDMAEVSDGLKAGERVVTRGSLFIDRAAKTD